MSKVNNNFNITTGHQQSNPLLDKMFKNAGIDATTAATTQNWDEIEQIYHSIAKGIVDIATEVNDSIKVINAMGITENKELEIAIRGLSGDIEALTKDMVAIHGRHEGFTGPVKDGDELVICLGVFNDYTILNDRFRAVVFPTVLTVTEHLANAVEAKRRQDAVKANVTDVIVKEETK